MSVPGLSLDPATAAQQGNEWKASLEQELAEGWADFVDCPRRLAREGPFLLDVLGRPPARVLDAAMGIGCEAVFLREQGFDVVGNEISPSLRAVAAARAAASATQLTLASTDWRGLRKGFGDSAFDSVLLLGNCLCLLRKQRDRRAAAENIRAVCKAGGSVVVDERNFEYILRNRDSILAGQFRYTGRVVYCGKTVKGTPVAIDDDCVRFVYKNIVSGVEFGCLDMHPFRRGELVSLFRAAGFREATVYSDFMKGYRPDCDFYTYVFR